MVSLLKQMAHDLCQGRMVLTLEGGYHLQALSYSVKATFDVLLGNTEIEDPLGQPAGRTREPDTEAIVQQVKQIHGL